MWRNGFDLPEEGVFLRFPALTRFDRFAMASENFNRSKKTKEIGLMPLGGGFLSLVSVLSQALQGGVDEGRFLSFGSSKASLGY